MIKYLLFVFFSFFSFSVFSSETSTTLDISNKPVNYKHPVSLNIDTRFIPKSPNDKREYASLTLNNKLEVLLISDKTSDKASAALDVNIGSSNDPSDFLGLAHFLEHMLFLGTNKYPTPDEYQQFISNHGGSHNAFTSFEHTNYFFDVQADFLEEALDRFSQQFTSPLFNEEYVEREVNAVHSEYTSKLKDDGRRYFSAVKATLSNNHPYSRFSVGNLETLKDRPGKPLRQALLDFYDSHYSANNMRLVVLGKEPIEQLKKWVESKFSNIPNKNIKIEKIAQAFFDKEALPAQLNVQSIMDKRSLTVAFPLKSDYPYNDSKPLNYIANLIGHEGKGSLLSKLKALDLVDGLSAGSEFDTQKNTIFMIHMSLTQQGLDQYEVILNTLFDYISILKKEGIKKLYFDEQAKLLDIAFEFQEKSEPIHLTSSLAMALHESNANEVLIEDYKLTNFNPQLYFEFIENLTPSNMLITLNAQKLDTDKETQWYQAPYKLFKLDERFVKDLEKTEIDKDLFMPYANEFIPENTSLLSQSNTQPELLKRTKGFDIWYAQDASFGTPKANIFLTLRSPISNSSASNANKTDILVSLLKDSLNEYSYPAYLAGLNFELYQHMRGITIKISGYNDKQSNLLIKIINSLKNAQFENDRFEIIKERLQRTLENAKDKKPFEQAISDTQNLLISPSWNESQKLNALLNLNLEDINAYREAFINELEAVLFANGNLTRASTLNIANQIEAIILEDSKKTSVDKAKIVKLTGRKIWTSALDVKHSDTGFIYYLQGNDSSPTEQAKFMLLNQILSTEYYGTIRTNKQLGYIVFSTNFSLIDVPAIAFIVQSPVASADALLRETLAFLSTEENEITKITSEELNRFKGAVISKLLKQDNTLYIRSNRYWQDIDRENYEFDTNEDIAKAISDIQLQDLVMKLQELIENKGSSLMAYTYQDEDKFNLEEFEVEKLTLEKKDQFEKF